MVIWVYNTGSMLFFSLRIYSISDRLKILTGRNPWCGNSIDALLHLEGLLRPLHPGKPEEVDEGHWNIMTWCWERNAADRLDAEAIALALDDLVKLCA